MMQILIFLMYFFVFSYSTPNLKVRINKSEKGVAYLFNTTNQKTDTISYNNHGFTYSGMIDEPTSYLLYFEGINNFIHPIHLILSKELTEIKFDSLIAVNESVQSWGGLYPNNPQFLKDPNRNESFYQFQNSWISFSDSIQSLSSDVENESIKTRRKALYDRFVDECGDIISANKDKLIGAFILEYLMINKLLVLNKIQEYYSFLDSGIQQSIIGKRIGNEAGLKVRSKAPDFEITDLKGNIYTLNKLKNKKVLLHFWSPTCAPCIEELPILLNLNDSDKSLTIINVSLDGDSVRTKKAIAKYGMTKMINTYDKEGAKSKIAQDYFVKAIPANYLLNDEGEIISKRESIEEIVNDLNLSPINL